ncbi:MAG: hypothetical protein AAB360_00740 [Patescibacteria group bacterium]
MAEETKVKPAATEPKPVKVAANEQKIDIKKYFPLIKWLIITAIVLAVLYFGTLPVRSRLSEKYLKQGDQLLVQKQYLSADLAYRKAEILSSKNKVIKERRHTAKEAAADIKLLLPFWQEKGELTQLSLYDDANAVPANEVEAVRLARRLIEQNEPQLALIPTQTALDMDKNYRDAWLYLGAANLQAAKILEISADARSHYLNQAKSALEKARELDPTYKPTHDLLAQITEPKT